MKYYHMIRVMMIKYNYKNNAIHSKYIFHTCANHCSCMGTNLVDEAHNKSRFLALIHTCGKWAVQLRALDCGRNLRERSHLPPRVTTCFLIFPPKLKTTRNKIAIQLFTLLALTFFFFYYEKPFIFCLICVVAAALKQSTVNSCTTFMTHGGLTPAPWLTWLRLPRGPSVMRRVSYLSFVFSVRYILHASEVEYFHKRHIFILTLEFVFIGSDDTL